MKYTEEDNQMDSVSYITLPMDAALAMANCAIEHFGGEWHIEEEDDEWYSIVDSDGDKLTEEMIEKHNERSKTVLFNSRKEAAELVKACARVFTTKFTVTAEPNRKYSVTDDEGNKLTNDKIVKINVVLEERKDARIKAIVEEHRELINTDLRTLLNSPLTDQQVIALYYGRVFDKIHLIADDVNVYISACLFQNDYIGRLDIGIDSQDRRGTTANLLATDLLDYLANGNGVFNQSHVERARTLLGWV